MAIPQEGTGAGFLEQSWMILLLAKEEMGWSSWTEAHSGGPRPATGPTVRLAWELQIDLIPGAQDRINNPYPN
ncbi:hypothetical protein DSO57_1009818 [Entomophthora muscae]|uniref:Uncharacterized protein n=1 Tax=Entomophthora muscae TaxID=34485 RepID=A0ACC2RXP2_9FUNG|nr:hypothetical protein DSO57_1009818 [Entomophthora muscae]